MGCEAIKATWKEIKDVTDCINKALGGWKWSCDDDDDDDDSLCGGRMFIIRFQDGFKVFHPIGWCGPCENCSDKRECPSEGDGKFLTLEEAKEAAEICWSLEAADSFLGGTTMRRLDQTIEEMKGIHRELLDEFDAVRALLGENGKGTLDTCRSYLGSLKERMTRGED